MNWPTLTEEPRITLELTLSELKHIIEALMFMTESPNLKLADLERNARMLDLLIQLESDLVIELNRDIDEEQQIREFGEI